MNRIVEELLNDILAQGKNYGRGAALKGRRALTEFVSANPNGPLTIGHGRGGALGDALAGLLLFAGAQTDREFYVNDATNSRQMTRFAQATLARLIAAPGETAARLDDGGYPEEYVSRVASALAPRFAGTTPTLRQALEQATQFVRSEQEATLAKFGLRFDHWFSEAELHAKGAVAQTVRRLRDSGFAYEQGGALWLRSTAFGDEDDRTLVRADGTPTYLAGDLAYHADKFARGYDLLVDIWSADHAGYIERTRAGLAALGYDPSRLRIILHGRVRFLQDGTEVRGGPFGQPGGAVTLEDVLEQVPANATRFLLLRVPAEVSLDLDGDLALRTDRANPLWRVNEARRLCREAAQKGGAEKADKSVSEAETSLLETLTAFPDVARRAAEELWAHHITDWAIGLSDKILINAARNELPSRLAQASAIALENSLDLLGIFRKNSGDV